MMTDVRWLQRLQRYEKAFANLADAVTINAHKELSKLEEQGLIKAFELMHEQAWLTLKDYFSFVGDDSIHGSRDAFRLALRRGIIEDGTVFMQSIKTRQLSVHTYNELTAEKIHIEIVTLYFPAFKQLLATLQALHNKG